MLQFKNQRNNSKLSRMFSHDYNLRKNERNVVKELSNKKFSPHFAISRWFTFQLR